MKNLILPLVFIATLSSFTVVTSPTKTQQAMQGVNYHCWSGQTGRIYVNSGASAANIQSVIQSVCAGRRAAAL